MLVLIQVSLNIMLQVVGDLLYENVLALGDVQLVLITFISQKSQMELHKNTIANVK